jgi:hypothetical protein
MMRQENILLFSCEVGAEVIISELEVALTIEFLWFR